jgi:acylphosphatase
MKRLSIVVSGRVQGVGFRFFAQEVAEELAISGWAKNTFDGNVEIEAQGEEESLAVFSKKIAEGPALANVNSFIANEIPVDLNEKIFTIRH